MAKKKKVISFISEYEEAHGVYLNDYGDTDSEVDEDDPTTYFIKDQAFYEDIKFFFMYYNQQVAKQYSFPTTADKEKEKEKEEKIKEEDKKEADTDDDLEWDAVESDSFLDFIVAEFLANCEEFNDETDESKDDESDQKKDNE